MGAFDYPAARFPAGLCAFGLLLALLDMGLIIARLGGIKRRFALVSGIGAEMLRMFGRWFRARSHHCVQRGLQQFHIMHVGAAGDERQRDATAVDQ